ncbi:MAG TPA: MerR family transcriptional regulator [Acidimicrobiales bacterium]
MDTNYRIAEVAERTGFTTTTLRYYEDIGLVSPAGRSAAGYRLYDDASLDRLRFVARAKALGCRLDEIADLASAWEGGECRPVQERLLATMQDRIADSQARIASLAAFTADLQRAAATLRSHTPDGPCDDACGCTSAPPPAPDATVEPAEPTDTGAADGCGCGDPGPGTGPVGVVLGRATPTDGVPIACTLDGGEMADRLDAWQAVLAGATAREPVDGGIRVALDPTVDLGAVAALAGAEHACCPFFTFAVTVDGRGPALEVRAPDDAADLVAGVFGAPS